MFLKLNQIVILPFSLKLLGSISFFSISIQDFFREKKIRNRKKERAARAIFYEIEHQTS